MVKACWLLGGACLSTFGAAELASHLSEAQRSQLQKIIQGDVGKHEVELVLAHFNEDASWSDPYASVRTIYCKGSQVPGCVPLENVGREGHTYLTHIVNNYDHLADWTVFSQAGAPGVGYNGHRLGGGHMQPGVEFQDYMLPDKARDSVFVFTGAMHLPSLFHAIRSSYLFPPTSPEDQLETRAQCPSSQTASDRWERLDLPKWFRNMMALKCGFQNGELQAHLQQYWQDHIKSDLPEDGMIFFSQGARFAASRDRIRQRSKEEYQDLLSLVSGTKDPCANYMNEWLWYYIMGKPQQAPCAVRDVDIEAPVSAAVRFLSGSANSGTSASDTGSTAVSGTGGVTTTVSSGNSSTTSGNSTGTTVPATTAAAGTGTTTEKTGEAAGALSHGLGTLAASVAALWAVVLGVQ